MIRIESNNDGLMFMFSFCWRYIFFKKSFRFEYFLQDHSPTINPHLFIPPSPQIAHDVSIGSHCNIAPRTVFAGHVVVGRGVKIGIGCTFHQNVTVGSFAMVAMASAVNRDIPPFVTYENKVCSSINLYGLQKIHGFQEGAVEEVRGFLLEDDSWPLELGILKWERGRDEKVGTPRAEPWFGNDLREFIFHWNSVDYREGL